MQAQVYCLAGLKAGAPAVRMEFLFLERPGEPVAFEYRQEDRGRLEDLLDEALSEIEESSFPPDAGPACGYCGVEGLCRAMNRRLTGGRIGDRRGRRARATGKGSEPGTAGCSAAW